MNIVEQFAAGTFRVQREERTVNDWKIRRVVVFSEEAARFEVLRALVNMRERFTPAGSYTQLLYRNSLWMSDTPDEVRDLAELMRCATGDVLVTGLGLGVGVEGLLLKPEVQSVLVIELEPDVIELVGKPLQERYGKLSIIRADAFEFEPTRAYDTVWHDIWNSISTDNWEDVKKLKRQYRRWARWQGCWCEDLIRREAGVRARNLRRYSLTQASIGGNPLRHLN